MIKAIGGVFLSSGEPETLAAWYAEVLGIQFEHSPEYDVWYGTFPFVEKDSGREAYQVFSVMRNENEKRGNTITVNLRVDGLESFIATLREKGVEVTGPETHPQGIFAWVNDPAGHKLELWEDIQER